MMNKTIIAAAANTYILQYVDISHDEIIKLTADYFFHACRSPVIAWEICEDDFMPAILPGGYRASIYWVIGDDGLLYGSDGGSAVTSEQWFDQMVGVFSK
jgi:hypothetical protein